MGKLRVVHTGPMSSIQDFGRFGYRKFGIPQSGAMDKESMISANRMVGNADDSPVVEIAMMGMKLEALESSDIVVVGAGVSINGEKNSLENNHLEVGDILQIDPPDRVYAYVAISGKIKAREDFGSVSTHSLAGFGGIAGKNLQTGDVIESDRSNGKGSYIGVPSRIESSTTIRMMKGPEWDLLKESPDKSFSIDSSSNRMGIRLNGTLDCDYREIASSAVIPGTVQLPANGQPIVLMNDCQTTGGYPRIGKVLDEDLGKLAQVRQNNQVLFKTIF